MPRKNQGCRSIGGGGEGASTSKKQKASSHSNSNRKDSPPFGDALSRVLRRSLLPRGYPMPSGFVGGMRLVNTFEDCFENLDGYNEEHTNIKLLASSVSQSIVSLASFKGRMRLFTCTGTVVGHTPSRMSILTSASLVRCYKDKSKIVDKLKIKVHLPNGKVAAGKLLKYDLYYNIAVVSIKSFPEFPAAHIHNQMQANLKFSQSNLVAIGRGFESGELMATGGTLLYKTSKLDCQELMTSTCKITKAGIGGPLIGSGGKFVGMNFYAKDETPFLPISILLKCLKHFDVFGRVVQPWLGLRIGSLQAQKLGIREEIHDSFPHAHGIYVEKMRRDTTTRGLHHMVKTQDIQHEVSYTHPGITHDGYYIYAPVFFELLYILLYLKFISIKGWTGARLRKISGSTLIDFDLPNILERALLHVPLPVALALSPQCLNVAPRALALCLSWCNSNDSLRAHSVCFSSSSKTSSRDGPRATGSEATCSILSSMS